MSGFEQFDKSMRSLTKMLIFLSFAFWAGIFGVFLAPHKYWFIFWLFVCGFGGQIIVCAVAFRSMAKLIERDWKEEMERKKNG